MGEKIKKSVDATTARKQVWICDMCQGQIHVMKQILIRCNRIEYWVHQRCAGIRLAQYADNWTCYKSRLTTHTDITDPGPSRPSPPPQHHRNQNTHIQLSLCSSRIGKAQTQSCHSLTPNISHPAPSQTHIHVTHSLYTSHHTHL